MVRPFSIAVATFVALGCAVVSARADGADMSLLLLQATARIGVEMAAGNHCAATELRPLIETTARYLDGAVDADLADRTLIDETRTLLDAAMYDAEPCDQPCIAQPAAPAGTGLELFAPETTARYLQTLDAVVSRWLADAERDPPTLKLEKTRHSYDPLPRYAPGAAVSYEVHVGLSCHGAVLWLDRPYTLPSNFDGRGSFIPPHEGLWAIDLRRKDGLVLSPLTYLDEAGLPTYAKEFWVRTDPTRSLGPGTLGHWHKRP